MGWVGTSSIVNNAKLARLAYEQALYLVSRETYLKHKANHEKISLM